MAEAWAQTAHQTEAVLGMTNCLCVRGMKLSEAMVFRNALSFEGKRLLLLYRQAIQSANNIIKQSVPLGTKSRGVFRPPQAIAHTKIKR